MAAKRPPFNRKSRLAFAGAGRLGSSLALAADRAGYEVAALSTRRAGHRKWLMERLPSAKVSADPAEAAQRADIVFVTASDSAVADVCAQIEWQKGQAAVHCAGVLPASVLSVASKTGAVTGGLHPLQIFPSPDAHARLKGVTFAVESADPGLAGWLRQFAKDLGGVPFDIKPEHRAAYHASAVMASGLVAELAGLAAEMWGQFGVPRRGALASLAPLIEATAAAIGESGLPGAVTGPYVRGDVSTIATHLKATAAQPPDVARAYAALALAGLHIAAERGRLTAGARRDIEEMLRQALRTSPGRVPVGRGSSPAAATRR